MPHQKTLSPENALERLIEGNERYHQGRALHPRQTHHFRLFTHAAQSPFAVISTCSDSRVPAEIIFDQGVGDLFVVRTAGNISSASQIGSIEYAVEYLGAKLVLVMGHTNCGAVTAVAEGLQVNGNIKELLRLIRPAVQKVAAEHNQEPIESWLSEAIKANVKQSIHDLLSQSPFLNQKIEQKEIKVVGALYHIISGNIEILD